MLSSQQRAAVNLRNLNDDLPLNAAAEDGTPVVNDDQLGDADDVDEQVVAVAANNSEDVGGVTSEPGSSRGRSAASNDGQRL